MRNLNTLVTVNSSVPVAQLCPPVSYPAATFAFVSPRCAAEAPLWAGVTSRPESRSTATAAGFAGSAAPAAAMWRGVDRDIDAAVIAGSKRVVGGYGMARPQQHQLHLTSRRDPRPWRPPV